MSSQCLNSFDNIFIHLLNHFSTEFFLTFFCFFRRLFLCFFYCFIWTSLHTVLFESRIHFIDYLLINLTNKIKWFILIRMRADQPLYVFYSLVCIQWKKKKKKTENQFQLTQTMLNQTQFNCVRSYQNSPSNWIQQYFKFKTSASKWNIFNFLFFFFFGFSSKVVCEWF